MPDLRETLARRLWNRLITEHPTMYRDHAFPNETDYGSLWTVADECIRQMRWTLAMTTEAYMLAAGPPNDVIAAPDDWEAPKS